MRTTPRLTAALAVILMLAACASLSIKQQAHALRTTVHQALITLDDFEQTLCQPAPAALNTCAAQPRVIPDTAHQRFSAVLSRAYDLDIRAGNAIIAWQPGMAIPSDLIELEAAAQQLFDLAQAFVPGSAVIEAYRARAQTVIDRVRELIATLSGGGAPPAFPEGVPA